MRDMFNINFLPRHAEPPILWTTKDGEKVQVTNINIFNAYKFCERQAQDLKLWMEVFATEAKRRGFQVQTKRSWFKRRVKR